VEQLVASAEAAVEEVVKRGVSLFDLVLHINDIFYGMSLWKSQDLLASDFYGSQNILKIFFYLVQCLPRVDMICIFLCISLGGSS
jgi:hypothetical protein